MGSETVEKMQSLNREMNHANLFISVSMRDEAMPSSDIYKTDLIIEREKKRLFSVADVEKDRIEEFLKRVELFGLSKVQILKYIQSLKYLRNFIGKNLLSVCESDLENFLLSMKNLKPKTRKIRWYSIKKFYDFLGNNNLFSKFKIRFEKSSIKLPEEILTDDEVNRMVEYCTDERRRAFLALLYESGCRIGEILSLKVGNVFFDNYGGVILVNGKTGQRRIRIVKHAKLLGRMIVFRNKEERIFNLSYPNAKKILKQIAVKVNIKKKVNPHAFRHARATHLAKFLTEAQLKEYFGWGQGSGMAAIYVHLSGRDVDDAILKANGIKMEVET